MSRTFSSLSIPNYRRYFVGATASNLGIWMARTGQAWLVLTQLTKGDAVALGFLTSLMFFPTLALTPIAGSIADRFPKKRIIISAQVLLFIDIVLLAVLTLTGTVELWHVFVLATLDGIAGAFDGPARQSIIPEIVPAASLSNAIGLGSMSFNTARLLGPGAAGALIAIFGTGTVFVINAFTYVILVACMSRIDSSRLSGSAVKPRGGILSAIAYLRSRPDLALMFVVAFVMGTFGFNQGITNPLMATEVFDKGAGEFGALGSIMGIGSLTAAILAARRPRPRIRHVVLSLGAFAGSIAASAFAPDFTTFMVLQIPIGLSSVSVMVTANAMVQIGSGPEVRGRVMALWGAVILGPAPIVAPLLGVVGAQFGARATVAVCAAGVFVAFVATMGYLFVHESMHMKVSVHRPFVQMDVDGEPLRLRG
ncbi:MAG TPA: MFS transporter [Propionibacteriaceae bacterium]|nr:MFS transporter [Propionibacteriaceae bacterium]